MKYAESKLDDRLRKWFQSDNSRALLRGISLEEGALRSLTSLDITFEYPITAVAGKNGAGKSTLLAMICCAFHADKSGYKLPKRNNNYYTFSDFFIQHAEEISPEGISIYYDIAYNAWKPSPRLPEGVGRGYQERKKSRGGKWNDYDQRVHRTVVFLGIERIVPHSERSQSRSYSRVFKHAPERGWERKVMSAVGYILGKKYDDFRFLEHSKYSLPVVRCGAITYSGFNMGAGENALFEIFSTIYAAGDGALLVLDEIELGLHSEAQRKLIEKLKDVCLEMHTQIVCTTHSKEIFECIPPDARFYIENVKNSTRVVQGISAEYAFSKLSARQGLELDLLVEDDVGMALVSSALPTNVRSRVNVIEMGSGKLLSRQLSAAYLMNEPKPIISIYDGDQRKREGENLSHAKRMAEDPDDDFKEWFENRIGYLPGDVWPESWLLQKAMECTGKLSVAFKVDEASLYDLISSALQAPKHKELYALSESLSLPRQVVLHYVANAVTEGFSEEFIPLGIVVVAALARAA
ncbi:ATP-dependent nuclease [Roseateles chitosanitabidus]|uniref:ATP-dependent nuclease n=1 Tax=Roseateles chitosanitabidus TaxID=65048 RepID=UPI000A07387E|nr:AAA family ATPase [Roseateles chitosanitabidus]